MNSMAEKQGFIRETEEKAKKAGVDKDTGLHRTGLETYLKFIFPNIDDWVHDTSIQQLNGKKSQCRPDYRSEKLKLIVEFDGIQHYTSPLQIRNDIIRTKEYEQSGYTVVRIPYFIQLTRNAIKTLFGIDMSEELFNPSIPSIGIGGKNTPAFLCPAGITRMAKEFVQHPEQYIVNINALKKENDLELTRWDLLENAYSEIIK